MTNPTPHGQVPEAFLKSVIDLCSHRGYSPENIEAWAKDDKWIADLWRQAEAMLAASPTPPAEQQAQPDECFPGEPKVAVPQGLISAACFAIRNKRDGGKVLEQLRRYSVGDRSQPLAPQHAATKAAPATQQAGEREQERIAFKDAHRHLELCEVPDAWGRPMFKHSHVEASWLGWIARASHGQAPAQAAPATVERPSDDAVMDRTRDLASSGRWPSDWVDAYRRGYADAAPTTQPGSKEQPNDR